jgi:hypothetical protein
VLGKVVDQGAHLGRNEPESGVDGVDALFARGPGGEHRLELAGGEIRSQHEGGQQRHADAAAAGVATERFTKRSSWGETVWNADALPARRVSSVSRSPLVADRNIELYSYGFSALIHDADAEDPGLDEGDPSYTERSSLIPTSLNTCPPGAWK